MAEALPRILAERFGCEFAVFCEIGSVLPPIVPGPAEIKPVSVPEPSRPKAERRPIIRLRSLG
jgi:hypothetical protein